MRYRLLLALGVAIPAIGLLPAQADARKDGARAAAAPRAQARVPARAHAPVSAHRIEPGRRSPSAVDRSQLAQHRHGAPAAHHGHHAGRHHHHAHGHAGSSHIHPSTVVTTTYVSPYYSWSPFYAFPPVVAGLYAAAPIAPTTYVSRPPAEYEAQAPAPHGAAPEAPHYLELPAIALDGNTFDAGGVRYRLNGIDAPGLREPLGEQARDRLQQLLSGGTAIAYPVATDAYGRVIADIVVEGVNVASQLRSEGFARR